MDTSSSGSRDWGWLPCVVLVKVVRILSGESSVKWSRAVSALASVNRYWRDSVTGCVNVIHIRRHRFFEVPGDFRILPRFRDLESVCLTPCSIRKAETDGTTERIISRASYGVRETDAVIDRRPILFNNLQQLKIDYSDELDGLLSGFCNARSLKYLLVENGNLERCPKGMDQLSVLKTLGLKDVELSSPKECLNLLTSMKQIEILALSFILETTLGSIAQLIQLQKLRYLKIHAANFDISEAHVLSELPHLQTLTIDDVIDGNEIDLSGLSQVMHLSIHSKSMPRWISSMPLLQYLNLTTSDDFVDWVSQESLLSIAERLKELHLTAVNASMDFIDRVLRASTNLEKLLLVDHWITHRSSEDLNKLREVTLIRRSQTRYSNEFLSVLSNLPSLEFLSVQATHILFDFYFNFLRRQEFSMQHLKALVISDLNSEGLTLVIRHLFQLRELYLCSDKSDVRPFENMLPDQLPELKNLCLSAVKVLCTARVFEMHLLTRLDHFGLSMIHLFRHQDAIVALKRRAPQLVIDSNLDWKTDDVFDFPDPFKSQSRSVY